MPQPVSNTTTIVSGSLLANKISYVVDGQGRNYRGGYGGLSWMSEVEPTNNVIFIGNSTTIGRGPADSPLFYPSFNNTEANIIYAVNKLPGSPGNLGTLSAAYNWATTNNFFINNSDNPISRINTDGLVFYADASQPTSYPQTGTSWYDLSGQANNGSLINGPSWNSNGWIVFDSTDDYINTSTNTNALFSNNDPFSVSITIKPTETINALSGLISNQRFSTEANPGGFGLVTFGTNQVAITLTKNDGTGVASYQTIAATTLTVNSWQNITYTYNPGTGTVAGYKNGTLVNSETSANYRWTPEARATWIARNQQGGWSGNFFSSEISNVSIYRKTLSEAEIKQNYFQGNIVTDGLVFMTDASNLVSYPKSGTTWYNLTGSSGNALFYNGPSYVSQNGGGISRDNTDDFISASISISSTSTYSVETWFKANPQTGANYNALISAWNYPIGAGGWELQFYNGVLGVHPTYTVAYTPNTIAHAVYTQNGTETKIYLNGVLQQTSTTSGVTLNNGSVGIGNLSAPGYGGYNLESTFYNVKIYNKTLTASEVQQNYEATKYKFQGQEIVTNGLVMYLDSADKDSYSGTGTIWDDLTGNENNGTLVNGPSFLSNQNGGVFLFDGVDDYISRAYNSTFNITTGLTLSVTVKRNSIFTQLADCFFLSRVPSWYFYDSYNSGNIRGEVFIDGVRRGAVSTSLPNDGKYYNIVYTYNSSTGLSAIYKNGSLATSVQLTGLSNYLIDSSTSNFSPLFFSNTGKSYFVGDIKIYNRALSATEVAQNFNAQRTRFGI